MVFLMESIVDVCICIILICVAILAVTFTGVAIVNMIKELLDYINY